MIRKIKIILVVFQLIPVMVFSQWHPNSPSNLEDVSKITTLNYDFEGKIKSNHSVATYENGKIKTLKLFRKGTLVEVVEYTYSLQANIEIIKRSNSLKEYIYTTSNEYDKSFRLIYSNQYNNLNTDVYQQTNFKYDAEDRLIGYSVISRNSGTENVVDFKIKYPNDSTYFRYVLNKKLGIEDLDFCQTYHEKGGCSEGDVITHEYEPIDRKRQKEVFKVYEPLSDNYIFSEIDTVDINEKEYLHKKVFNTTISEYDERGNWTSSYLLINEGERVLISRRKIEYKK